MNKLKIWLQHSVLILCLFGLPTTALQAAESGSDIREPELMQLLSPIALYPDTLLTHMLIASTYPLELVQAQRWRKQRSHWSNERLMAEAENQDWDPSVMALIAFPEVLNKMSTDLDWTARLGEAFIADEGRVMDGIQTLRQAAWNADSLNDLGNLNARRDERQIVIAPTRTEVIYVPYYDSRRVYGHWHWSSYPPIYWDPFPGYVRYHSSPFYWRSAGVSISFNFFFSAFHWHDRVIWVDYRHKHYNHYRPRLAYSQGAQRWSHNPHHRRGAHYRHPGLQQRYNKAVYNKPHKRYESQARSFNHSQRLHQDRNKQQKQLQHELKKRREHNSREWRAGDKREKMHKGEPQKVRQLSQQPSYRSANSSANAADKTMRAKHQARDRQLQQASNRHTNTTYRQAEKRRQQADKQQQPQRHYQPQSQSKVQHQQRAQPQRHQAERRQPSRAQEHRQRAVHQQRER
ncbi:DUF3300 domain-containing protein [Shewanella algae]|uniref:DUF3300 domain-containing protein n=1 Tax=Shewanella algae TaxID=38313 RepID=UPI001AAD1F07|nr:DUF3300 domain-containing protein [Shewanella algae]MBO2598432.1 DUF3300 domain-containing protein [Shewanella algae]BCV27212.1 hypothetical protein TUM3811_10720 [Shewanella algae]